jgi:hypothetical protein
MTKPRKLIQGIGINDMPGRSNDRHEKPSLYGMWNNILLRVTGGENGAFYKENPTYRGTTVCEEWLTLSNFITWVESHENWRGKRIDKDILCPGNKHYSPETCVLVSTRLNNLLTDRAALRGECPKGVNRDRNRYRARLGGTNGKHLGNYDTKKEAHRAYCEAKEEYIREWAENLTGADTCDIERTREALLKHAVIEGNAWRETEDSQADSVPTLFG